MSEERISGGSATGSSEPEMSATIYRMDGGWWNWSVTTPQPRDPITWSTERRVASGYSPFRWVARWAARSAARKERRTSAEGYSKRERSSV